MILSTIGYRYMMDNVQCIYGTKEKEYYCHIAVCPSITSSLTSFASLYDHSFKYKDWKGIEKIF
jgi:hypothetical protein